MKKLLLLLLVITISFAVSAQSPFKRLPIRSSAKFGALYGTTAPKEIVAYRFTLPFAGYSPVTKQISTGLGFGYNRLHYVDSTARYYTDLSVFAAIFANGNVTPTPYSFASVGVGIGFLNNLIMIVPAYSLPNAAFPKGAFDVKISLGVPLN